jgi:methylmalonyl-CoA mutase cobalamin-binding domain/chain
MTDLAEALVALDKAGVVEEVRRRADDGADPTALVNDLRQAMEAVGERYKTGEFYLAELMLTASIFSEAVAILDPLLADAAAGESTGVLVLATPKGDIHDLGKNIVATMLRASGFEVHDLGVDVEPERIVEEVRRVHPDFVGFSALLTTTLPSVRTTIDMLNAEGLHDDLKILVGGGVTTAQFKDHVGADFQTLDVVEGVEYCLDTVGRGAAGAHRRQ